MCKLIICSKHRMYNFNFRLLTIWVIALAANLVFLAKFRGKFEKAMKNHLDLSLRKINSLWNHRCYTHTHILLIKLYSISKFIFLSIRCVFGPVAFNWILNLISLLITNNISVNVPLTINYCKYTICERNAKNRKSYINIIFQVFPVLKCLICRSVLK